MYKKKVQIKLPPKIFHFIPTKDITYSDDIPNEKISGSVLVIHDEQRSNGTSQDSRPSRITPILSDIIKSHNIIFYHNVTFKQ